MSAAPVPESQGKRRAFPGALGPLPRSGAGQKLAELFANGWDWIFADNPGPDGKPNWRTVTRYPLTPIEQERQHQDPAVLIGTRPGSQTRWIVIDLDIGSAFHPANNPHWLPNIQAALEEIGLPRLLICQSSHSGGLHLYAPLPEAVSSYWLSICVKLHLEAIGIKLQDGQCELYPNPKRWVPQGQGFSKFAAIRLPSQPESGFFVLDDDLNIVSDTLDAWLLHFERCAAQQDMSVLARAIALSKETFRLRRSHQPQTLESWQGRIEAEKQQGWTGPGQTNEKLKLFGCEARVFLGMDSPAQIAEHIEQTALNCPGFHEHSNHVHNLKSRSQEVAHWAYNFYWPNGTAPQRSTDYHGPQPQAADFAYHQSKRDAAHYRIEQAVAELTANNQLSDSITERAKQIEHLAHVSSKTLYRVYNKPLWHPKHCPPLESAKASPVVDLFQLESEPALVEAVESLNPLLIRTFFLLLIYVGFVNVLVSLWAAVALAPEGQRATIADPPHPSHFKQDLEGGLGGAFSTLDAWAELKSTLSPSLQRKIAEAEHRQSPGQCEHKPVESLPTRLDIDLDHDVVLQSWSAPDAEQFAVPEDWSRLKSSLSPELQRKIGRAQAEYCPGFESGGSFSPSVPPALPFVGLDLPVLVEDVRLGVDEEFSVWFDLAIQLNIVSDSEWDGDQYWVESRGEWVPYCELSATFSLRMLKRMLGQLS